LVVGLVLAGVSAGWAEEELRPIPAAEAERRVAEVRDALTEVLWIGIDGYWHEGDWEACLRLNKEIVALDPQFVDAWTSAAWVLWSNDRDKEAVEVYKEGIEANPDSPDLYFDYGFFLRNRKRFDEAIPMFRKACEKGATKAQQHMFPNTLEEAGRKAEALKEWRKLLERFPEDAVAKGKIGRLEEELGHRE
jgi:Tfp pilus assembly protein PilF